MSEHKKVYLIVIIIASLATHFLFFGQPRETVFDEVHFGKFISGYFTHEYFFDIHPPLGKLMISGMGYLTGFKPGFSFAKIGDEFPDNGYLWLRLLPTIAGTLLPIVIYFLILQLGISRLAAFSGGMLVVLENSLLVQSRFILLDSFLLLFGFSSLLFYFKYQNLTQAITYNLKPIIYLFLAGFFASLAMSVKWTGATFLALILAIEFVRILKRILNNRNKLTSRVGVGLAMSENSNVSRFNLKTLVLALVVVPFAVYFSIFALHFSLLSKSGPGDAFMTPGFRKTLEDSAENKNPDLLVEPLSIWGKFIELNKQMYKSNATLTAGHPYSSKWYTWPFMIRPIYYWNKADANNQPSTKELQPQAQKPQEVEPLPATSSRIYFLGNPVIWWASTAAMLYLLINLLSQIFRPAILKLVDFASQPIDRIGWFLGGAYLLNLLPFIGIKRAMFLYHYLIGLIFAIIALVYLIDKFPKRKTAFAVLVAASFAAFIFFAPLTYGLPLSEKAYNFRVWFKNWL